jgi:hypothetical protein
MKDYQTRLEKLRTEPLNGLISDLATDPAKRRMFDRLALHLTSLANEVEQAMLHRKPGKLNKEVKRLIGAALRLCLFGRRFRTA